MHKALGRQQRDKAPTTQKLSTSKKRAPSRTIEGSMNKKRHRSILSSKSSEIDYSQSSSNSAQFQQKSSSRRCSKAPSSRKPASPQSPRPKLTKVPRISKFPKHGKKMKYIYRWMWVNSTRSVKGYKAEFDGLLDFFGFTNPAITALAQKQLRAGVEEQIKINAERLKIFGAYTLVANGNKKPKMVRYAEWTEAWMSPSWDGDIRPPHWTHVLFNPYWGKARELLYKRDSPRGEKASDSLLDPELFVVEEREAENPQRPDSDAPQVSHESQIISLEQFNYLCRSNLANSNPGYRVDVSELPQYNGVQLTPCLKDHPVRPDPLFWPVEQDQLDGEMHESEQYNDGYMDYGGGEEDHDDYEDIENHELRGEGYQADVDSMVGQPIF